VFKHGGGPTSLELLRGLAELHAREVGDFTRETRDRLLTTPAVWVLLMNPEIPDEFGPTPRGGAKQAGTRQPRWVCWCRRRRGRRCV
jgi:hypothetical protein